MKNIRICVVYGDSLLAEGIESMLRNERGLTTTGVNVNEENLAERLGELHPHIILVDQNDSLVTSMTLQSGHIFEAYPEAKLIIVDLDRSRVSVHYREETIVNGRDGLIDAVRRIGMSGHEKGTKLL